MPVPVSNGVTQITQIVRVISGFVEFDIQTAIDTQAGNNYTVQEIETTASSTIILFTKNEIVPT